MNTLDQRCRQIVVLTLSAMIMIAGVIVSLESVSGIPIVIAAVIDVIVVVLLTLFWKK